MALMPKLSLSFLLLLGTALTTTRAEPPSPNYVYSNYDSPYSLPDEYNEKGQGGGGGGRDRDHSDYPPLTENNPQEVDDAGYPIGGSGSYMPGGTPGADDYGYTELDPKHPYRGPSHKPLTHSYSPPNAYQMRPNNPPPRRKPSLMANLFRLRSKPSRPPPKYHHSPVSYSPMKHSSYSSYGTLPGKPYSPTQSGNTYSYSPKGYKAQSSYKNYSPPSYPQHAPSGPSGVSHSPSMYSYGGGSPSPKPSKRPPPPSKPQHAPPTKETVKIKYQGHMPPPPKYSAKARPGYRYSSYDGTHGSGAHPAGGSGIDNEDLFGRQYCRNLLSKSKDYERYTDESYAPHDDAYGGGYDMGTSHY